ncbi:MAG: thioredoxin domain-containing protein [Burkholderiaceae bacterium]|nr:thioredoxin domain-containing protein [Burkholderiaceae bacterium]
MNRKTLFIGSAVLLLAAFVIGAIYYQVQLSKKAEELAAANQTRLLRVYSPTFGNPQAKVHIVEFLDPACGTCAQFYPEVKRIMADNPDRIRLTIRHVPFHNGSEPVVRVLEASRAQDKYLETLRALLGSQSSWVVNHTAQFDRIWGPLQGLGLDLDKLRVDMNAPEIGQHIEQDLADASALGVQATPEFFVNGRPLPSFGLRQLQDLVKDALQASY